MIVVGMMSGTSMDGLDIAVADISFREQEIALVTLGNLDNEWPAHLRSRLLAVLAPSSTSAGEICQLDTLVGQYCAGAAQSAIAQFAPNGADLIASHGQTVYHWVTDGRARGTLQLGQPAWVAEATGLPVISDFRSKDIAAGGQGAPLASTLDALWLADPGDPGAARAALNLGGIANITVIGKPAEPVVAFDTGPANCLLDAAIQRMTSGRLGADIDGRLALSGTVRSDLLQKLLAEPYYRLPPPKSTGRELFAADYVDRHTGGLPPITDADLMATLTELSAATVAQACAPFDLREVVASGGGVRNPALMTALRRRLGSTTLLVSEERGLPSAGKEAYLIALLGFLSWFGVPGVVPGATGSTVPRVLGSITPGNRALRLPEPASAPTRLTIRTS